MTPEEARRFLAYVDIDDEYRLRVEIGNNGKRVTEDYQGKVTTINKSNFWLDVGGLSPQVIHPQHILESELLKSPIKEEFGTRHPLK